eukprot:tig00000405_g460.t1
MESRMALLERDKHVDYMLRLLQDLPDPYAELDHNRLSLCYFAVSGLDVLGALDRVDGARVVEWVYSLQVAVPAEPIDAEDIEGLRAGFRGGAFATPPAGAGPAARRHDLGNLAMTYCALSVLRILGDDLSRVDRPRTLRAARALQGPDGGFSPHTGGSERDMRYLYCAAAVCHHLGDWGGMDVDAAAAYVAASQTYEGGLGMGPGQEAHAGSTYCGLAALRLMGRLGALRDAPGLLRWLAFRQVFGAGFAGRANKAVDTCYSFWAGASLALLRPELEAPLSNGEHLRGHTLACQHAAGGFSKWPRTRPDPLHTYYALCGLALAGQPGLAPLEPALAITCRAAGDLAPPAPPP